MRTVTVVCTCRCGGSGTAPVAAMQADAFINDWLTSHRGGRCKPSAHTVAQTVDSSAAFEREPALRSEQWAWVDSQLAKLDSQLAARA